MPIWSRVLLPLCGLALLAGCAAKPLAVDSISGVSAKTNGSGANLYSRLKNDKAAVSEYSGEQIVDIRTFKELKKGRFGPEFAGAKCHLDAPGFEATVTSPAKVRVPIFRSASSDLAVRCTHPDYSSKLVTRSIVNKTKNDRLSAGSAGGLAGIALMAVVNGVSDDSNDTYMYAPIQVPMLPLKL